MPFFFINIPGQGSVSRNFATRAEADAAARAAGGTVTGVDNERSVNEGEGGTSAGTANWTMLIDNSQNPNLPQRIIVTAGNFNEAFQKALDAGIPQSALGQPIRLTSENENSFPQPGVRLQDTSTGATDSTTSGGGGFQTPPQGTSPVDVQSFPFASFANALSGRGFDTEGVLGSTFSQQFQPLELGRTIGQFTGTIPDIGQSPGALESFFANNFGDTSIAQRIFNDLRGGNAAAGLSGDDNIRLDALRTPDLATSSGRSAAQDVFDLARAASQNRFGAAANLLGNNQALSNRFSRGLARGNQPDFLSFVSNQLGV